MRSRTLVSFLSVATVVVLAASAAAQAPIVIAHRGASGYLPEHTLVAYALAYGQGADYIEPDLVLTKDAHFICLHDIHLESTTNVETVFPSRRRSDGRWYAADFSLDEIKQLNAHERLPNRFPQDKGTFQVPTFEEMIELVLGLNESTGRHVGIYPELKQPLWHDSQGLPMEKAVLEVLSRYDLAGKNSRVFLQCFEQQALEKIRDELRSEIPTVLLIDSGRPAQLILTQEGLAAITPFANGIGLDKRLIERNPKIVDWAHDAGLVVHPYTFRADDFPTALYDSFEDEIRRFITVYQVDGFFTDFAGLARPIVDASVEAKPKRRKKR